MMNALSIDLDIIPYHKGKKFFFTPAIPQSFSDAI